LLPKEKLESCNICLTTIPQSNQVILGNDKQFTFDHVFDPVSKQGDIYATTVVPLLDAVFQGYNATAFAYGQTGSGKSYTMGTATCADDADQGIIPRVIHDLFARIERAQHNCQFEVFVSYIEIYNETLKDLLHPATSPKQISIREDDSGGIVVCGAQTQRAHTIAELWSLVQHGTTYRATAATMMNTASSRSHSILTLHLQQQEGDPYNGEYRRAKFHLVDLAGSERNKRTGNIGIRFKESVGINTGLLALGNVISILSDEKRRPSGHVPYRDSKLTRLLQDSLGGNSRTVMLACISPADANFEETLSTLKYASRARCIKNRPVVNRGSLVALRELQLEMYFGGSSVPPDVPAAKEWEEQVKQLEQEVAFHREQLVRKTEALHKAEQDLQRDEEIFDEKMKELKAAKKSNKELMRQNAVLSAQLQHALEHAAHSLIPCPDPECVVRAMGMMPTSVKDSDARSPHLFVRRQSHHLAFSQEESDQVEISCMAESDITETTGCNAIDASEMCGGHSQMEAEKSKEEIHSELLDMETRFNHFKNKLLQEVKDLTIRDKLKEQLICELLKTESFAQEKNQLYEAKVQDLETRVEVLKGQIQQMETDLNSSEAEGAAKEAMKQQALAKLHKAEHDLDKLRGQYASQCKNMRRQIQELERRSQAHPAQRKKERPSQNVKQQWLDKEIERCLQDREQAERLEAELKRRERLLREREQLLKQREIFERKQKDSTEKGTHPASSHAKYGPQNQRLLGDKESAGPSAVALSAEEEQTLMALQEESESKQVVLDYVDTVIDEAKRELFEGLDAGDLSQSLDFQPSEIKRLATQKLNTKFQQILGNVYTINEAKSMCIEYMNKIVDYKEVGRKNARNVARLEARLADCTRENMELSNQLKFLTEEYAKLNEEHALLVADSQHQQSTTISALGMSGTLNPEEEMHRLNKDAQYYRNANKMLKGHLREVLIEYNQQQQRLHISEREIRELTQMNEGLQEQLANLKAYLSNRHNVREHRVDTSKLKALSPEVIQERKERLPNSSLMSANTSTLQFSPTTKCPEACPSATAPQTAESHAPASAIASPTRMREPSNESLLELLEAFERRQQLRPEPVSPRGPGRATLAPMQPHAYAAQTMPLDQCTSPIPLSSRAWDGAGLP
jgi:hypothetical protein